MAIITEKKVLVKSAEEKQTAQEKWTEKKRSNIEISRKFLRLASATEREAEKMHDNDNPGRVEVERIRAEAYRKRGYRMKECGRFITVSTCPDCGRSEASSATLCRDRVCPTCSWRLAAKQSAEMLQTLALINDIEDYTAAFLTLTVKNCEPDQLPAVLDMMSEAWHRMAMKKKFKELVKGTARSTEITYNAKTRTFHPHYHIILMLDCTPERLGELNAFFNEEWGKAARLVYQPITDLRLIENRAMLETDKPKAELYKKAILETFKYTIKDDSLKEMPLYIFRYYVDGVQGKRLINYTGIIKEARGQLEFTEELDEDGQTSKKCPECNADMLQAVYQWSFAAGTYQRFEEIVKAS